MAKYYYLMNGKDGYSNSVCLLDNGYLVSNFNDIATLDILTMSISRKESKEILKEYNPKLDLDGFFYDAVSPNTKGNIITYATIFNYEDENSKKCLERLKYFAEQRKYKVENNLNLQLDKDRVFEDYIRTLLYNILNKPKCSITDEYSIVALDIKKILNKRYESNVTTDNFINANIYTLRDMLTGYTALRNLVLEYVRFKNNDDLVIRNLLKNRTTWENRGMELSEPIKYEKDNIPKREIYKQLKLDDFMYIPRIRQI